MKGEFGTAEPDAVGPVPLDTLGELYRADPESAGDMLHEIPESQRVRLALFCYNRSHLRDLALTIAASCDPIRLGELAGTLGQVLAAQCRGRVRSFGKEPAAPTAAPKVKVSLGGSRR